MKQEKFRMMMLSLAGLALAMAGCHRATEAAYGGVDVEKQLAYCARQAARTLEALPAPDAIPNAMESDSDEWDLTTAGSWTCGFWPGELWYLYEATRDSAWYRAASRVTEKLVPLGYRHADSHDVGFMMTTSLGNGFRLTRSAPYRQALLAAADSLSRLYNPKVGTLLSWPGMVEPMGWPHNTIIDNMMNLELLFWAAANGGSRHLYDIAVRHAETTMRHQFREDGSVYHVAVYDAESGAFIKGVTHQGWKDESMWARGQAWAIYGFTMSWRFTRDKRFLETAKRAATCYLDRLPGDWIPYWDFDAAEQLGEDQPRDASAAAIAASALLELADYETDAKLAERFRAAAVKTLERLSSEAYQGGDAKSAMLLHSTGHMPKGGEVDAALSYADYYYLEALLRLARLQRGEPVLERGFGVQG